jgi:hypothetical protein
MKSRVRIYTLEEQIQDACRINIDEHRRSERARSFWVGILPRDPALWIEVGCLTLICAVLIPVLIAGVVLMFAVMIGAVHGAMALVAACPWVIFLVMAAMVPERTEPNRR